MKSIVLTRGRKAYVDANVYENLNAYRWHWVDGGKANGYAMRWLAKGDPLRSENQSPGRYLHHDVLGVSGSVHVDHRNENGLDCRKENLRIADRSKNGANRSKFTGRFTSKYKGVVDRSKHFARSHMRAVKVRAIDRPWLARIRVKGQLINLGLHATERDAAVAYDRAAVQHFGEFAKTNFPAENNAL